MHRVEMMVMSGVLRSAEYKPPRPALLLGKKLKPRDSREETEPDTGTTGDYLAERIAQLFANRTSKGIWTLHR